MGDTNPPQRRRRRRSIEEELEGLRREELALSAKIMGSTNDAIARELGVEPSSVYKIIGRALKRRRAATDFKADQWADIIGERYEYALRKLAPAMEKKDREGRANVSVNTVWCWLAVCRHQAELRGANQAAKVDVTSGGKPIKQQAMPTKTIVLVRDNGEG